MAAKAVTQAAGNGSLALGQTLGRGLEVDVYHAGFVIGDRIMAEGFAQCMMVSCKIDLGVMSI